MVIRTLARAHEAEIPRVRGSRFLGTAGPVPDTSALSAFVAGVRAAHPDATHHCFAWRGDGPDAWRWADDGEPAGTAGRPILRQIDGRGLTGVAVVIARWFGGTKLGTGGLARAYGEGAAAVLDGAAVVERRPTVRMRLRWPWQVHGAVEAVLAGAEAETIDAAFADEVRRLVAIAAGDAEAVRRALVEASAGRIRFEEP